VSSFGWRPRGLLLPVALRLFGSAPVRELSALTGWLPRASSTRFGVGRWMSTTTRRAWRAGLADRPARRVTHRLFLDAARDRAVQRDAEAALAALADRPVLTVFGELGDHFRFQRQWRRRRPDLTRCVVRRGLHFPMCDDPTLVADQLHRWISGAA
jgi:haloalkane dehalogenase